MHHVLLLPSTAHDLNQILQYITHQTGNLTIGQKFIARLKTKIDELAASSFQLGRPRPELQIDLRSIPYKNYIIFFRYMSDTLEIVNILEAHRDLAAFYEED